MTLYRSHDKILGGVCAGVAKELDVNPWMIRIATLFAMSAYGAGIFIYIILWAVLDMEDTAPKRKNNLWQEGEPPRKAFNEIASNLNQLEDRLRKIEYYVTDNNFALKRQIEKL